MRNSPSRLVPFFSRRLIDVSIDSAAAFDGAASGGVTHPVTARIERIDAGHEGEIETIDKDDVADRELRKHAPPMLLPRDGDFDGKCGPFLKFQHDWGHFDRIRPREVNS